MQFIKTFIIATCIILASVIGINYFIDPKGIFFQSFILEKYLAHQINSGSSFPAKMEWNQRMYNRFRVEGASNPDAIVLGSSRSQLISGDMLGKKNLVNLNFSLASIEDFIAIANFLRKKDFKNSVVYIQVDPWILNSNFNPVDWRVLESAYAAEIIDADYGVHENIRHKNDLFEMFEKWSQLLNYAYTIESVKKIHFLYQIYFKCILCADESSLPLESEFYINKDGTAVYPRAREIVTEDQVLNSIKKYHPPIGWGEGLSPEKIRKFETLIKELSKKNSVKLIRAPFHPQAYKLYFETQDDFLKFEKNIIDIARKNHVLILGSFNPIQSGCSQSDFYDAVHPKVKCIRNLFDKSYPYQANEKK